MKLRTTNAVLACLTCVLAPTLSKGAAGMPGIERVELEQKKGFHVNGKPFFPIMAWLQEPRNFETIKSCGMNAVAGYWPKSGGTRDVREYLDLVEKSGLYGIVPFDGRLKGHRALLGYIHGDEPDLPQRISDAIIEPGQNLRINPQTPLWKLVDGDVFSWSVLDPLKGASVTVKLRQAVTVKSLAVWLTVSEGLSAAHEIAFECNGKELLRATVAPKRGQQKFDLPHPATLSELTVRILSVTPAKNVWGSLGEIEGFDEDGKNVLLSPPRTVPRSSPADVLREYRAIKEADSSRPVFMTLTGYFHPFFNKYDADQMKMYPEYVTATDVVGFDIYPIYGWNKPEWIHLVHEGTELLVEMSGARPVYAWIETSKGSRWTGELAEQKDVKPEHIRAEVWMAICRGATAIGYFTHVWKPSYSQFGVPLVNRDAMAQINAQITRLTPAILGDEPKRAVSTRGEDVAKLDLLAKCKNGELYIFAVNYDESLREARVRFNVQGMPALTKVTVVDEARTITSEAGFLVDVFQPLAVHIYRIGLAE